MLLEWLARAVQSPLLMWLATPAFGHWHPFRRSFRRDPYPAYHKLRERAPRYYHRIIQSWVFSTHADVQTLLADPRLSVERGESDLFKKYMPFETASDRLQDTLFRSLLMIDPPDHTRIRGLVTRAFTPRTLERLEPRVQTLTEQCLASIRPGEPYDVLERLAVPLPLTVICEMLGVPTDRLPDLKHWSEVLTQLLDPLSVLGALKNSQQAMAELAEYFDGLFEARRADPQDDLLTALVQAEDAGDRLSDAELLSLVALLLAAGHETTTNLIANSVLALEDRPDLRRRLVEEPAIVGAAVEELLRFDSSVQITDRVVLEDMDYGGVHMRRGQMAVMLLGAANRDPAAFPLPDVVDFDRPNLHHMSFGHGPHFCLGAALARLEARVVLPRLFEALGDYRVLDRERLEWKPSLVLRGPVRLGVGT